MKEKLAQAIVKRTIRDLSSDDMSLFREASATINDAEFGSLCRKAGYPDALLDTLECVVARSRVERKILTRQLIEILRTQWDQPEA